MSRVLVTPRERSAFLTKCKTANLDPVDELVRLGVKASLTVSFMEMGLAAHKKHMRLRAKELARAGRENEIEDETARNEAVEDEARREQAEDEFSQRFLERTAEIVTQFERAIEERLFNKWMLSGGVSLGDATGQQLMAESAKEEDAAGEHLKNKQFYAELAARIPDGATVRASLKATEVEHMRARVFGVDLAMVA